MFEILVFFHNSNNSFFKKSKNLAIFRSFWPIDIFGSKFTFFGQIDLLGLKLTILGQNWPCWVKVDIVRSELTFLGQKIFIKMKFRNVTKKCTFDSAIKFPKNRFYRLWSSQGPPASVRVKLIVSLHFPPLMKT